MVRVLEEVRQRGAGCSGVVYCCWGVLLELGYKVGRWAGWGVRGVPTGR